MIKFWRLTAITSSLCLFIISPVAIADDYSRRHHDRHSDYRYATQYNRGLRQDRHHERGFGSFTSHPIRGGSSRRTRIIENPYSNRLVTGITLTGLDNDIVHIKDIIAYPARQFLSPLGYTLSIHHPQRFINTGHYIDYISVKAKRKEYFTVTFHYD